jgi:hypothetical protein
MFVCEECLKPTDKHSIIPMSHGRCEVCGLVKDCYEVSIQEMVEKDFEVMVVAYVLDRTVKAKNLNEAKNKVSDWLIEKGGYSTGLKFLGRQISWLHEKYPRDIGYEPVTEWK